MILQFPNRKRRNSGDDPFSVALVAELPRLRRYALALIGDSSLADDLIQDCVERALVRRKSLAEPQYIYAWLRSILHNLYIDALRRRGRRGAEVDVDEMTDILALSVPAGDRGAMIDFTRAVGGMTVEHRQILLLVGLEGLSYREIADELGIPLGTVMSRLARAREQLRGRLDQGLDDAGNQEAMAPSGKAGAGPVRKAMK